MILIEKQIGFVSLIRQKETNVKGSANTFILYCRRIAFCITFCVMVSKCHLSPFMYKTAKCLPGILLDAETDWKQLNYNLYIWLCIIVSPYCVCI